MKATSIRTSVAVTHPSGGVTSTNFHKANPENTQVPRDKRVDDIDVGNVFTALTMANGDAILFPSVHIVDIKPEAKAPTTPATESKVKA